MTKQIESPIVRMPNGDVEWTQKSGDKYVVTGVAVNGERFRLVFDTWIQAKQINVYRGTRWLLRDGRKHKIQSIYN